MSAHSTDDDENFSTARSPPPLLWNLGTYLLVFWAFLFFCFLFQTDTDTTGQSLSLPSHKAQWTLFALRACFLEPGRGKELLDSDIKRKYSCDPFARWAARLSTGASADKSARSGVNGTE
ncbi:hypothetical protein BCR44DRAFT_1237286 [Catenaria anguillulae PL171]|uniref:Uncharacterized protein n=1 Tax=Catenaria anguillulae PL171 TaxID=765915 RepID=A0A1Y2GHP5_9FUNG|nr:hypothetical protein BCR44DRAFT_1237286 [Catenaria anguillulae PL171]